jgi:hypothetical protein
MWAWDNPVSPADDPRGRGYAPAAPDRLAAFARAGGLREVHLLAPSGPTGPVDDWFRDAVTALHDAGVAVTGVAEVRDATAAWAQRTTALGPVDRLQVVVLPWVAPAAGGTVPGVGRLVGDALVAVRAAGTGRPVDACVPWWFAGASAGSTGSAGSGAGGSGSGPDGGELGPVVAAADRVVLAAPGARAEGAGGILELAAPGVSTLAAAGRPFLVGVETDSPDAAGAADRTFWDEGPVAMLRECGVVAGALGDAPGFEGVAVASHRAWRRLLGV